MKHWPPQPWHRIFVVILVSIFSVIDFISCSARKNNKAYQSPPGYDFNQPIVYKLPESLNEISGVIFYAKDSSLFAVNDEEGYLYKIYLKDPLEIQRWKFSDGGDYEDIALLDSNFFVVKSKGKLEKFKFHSGDTVSLQEFEIPVAGKKEFESLFYDKERHQLIMVCKDCKEGGEDRVTTWAFDPASDSFYSSAPINTLKIMEQRKSEDEKKFKPSAAAIHPLTGELYMISNVNKLLVIFDKQYNVKTVLDIDPKLFKQPEGLAFTTKGDLIITNESADAGPAEILFYKKNNLTNPE